jgi:hypothetical protein
VTWFNEKVRKLSLAEAQRAQRGCSDRIYRITRIIVFQNIKTKYLVDPVDPV